MTPINSESDTETERLNETTTVAYVVTSRPGLTLSTLMTIAPGGILGEPSAAAGVAIRFTVTAAGCTTGVGLLSPLAIHEHESNSTP